MGDICCDGSCCLGGDICIAGECTPDPNPPKAPFPTTSLKYTLAKPTGKSTSSGTKSLGLKLPKTKGDFSVDIPTGTGNGGSKATGTGAGTGGPGLGAPTATGMANGTIAGGVNGTLPIFTGRGARGVSLFLNSVCLGVVSLVLGFLLTM